MPGGHSDDIVFKKASAQRPSHPVELIGPKGGLLGQMGSRENTWVSPAYRGCFTTSAEVFRKKGLPALCDTILRHILHSNQAGRTVTESKSSKPLFSRIKWQKVEYCFDSPRLTSHAAPRLHRARPTSAFPAPSQDRRRRDSNPGITDLQSVAFVHLATPPNLPQIPQPPPHTLSPRTRPVKRLAASHRRGLHPYR